MTCPECGQDIEPTNDGRCPACRAVLPLSDAIPPLVSETAETGIAPAAQTADAPPESSEQWPAVILPPPPFDAEAEPLATEAADAPVPPPRDDTAGRTEAHAAKAAGADIGTDSGYGPFALDRLVELLRDRRAIHIPTIAVVGSYSVGKTFFIEAVAETCKAKDGYVHFPEVIDNRDPNAPKEERRVLDNVGPQILPQPKAIEMSRKVTVHDFLRADGDKFRIIDIPGEFFFEAMNDGIDDYDDERIKMLYPIVSAADGYVLLVPAPDVFNSGDRVPEDVKKAPELLQKIAMLCRLIDSLVEGDDRSVAVSAAMALAPRERRMIMSGQSGRSPRPALLLLSQADRCFGCGEDRNPKGASGDIEESDPLLCVAGRSRDLISQLNAAFEKHKIDFLTADENGHVRLAGQARVQFGAWAAIGWMLRQIRPQPKRNSLRTLLGMTDRPFAFYRRKSAWVLRMRERGDPNFRRIMQR